MRKRPFKKKQENTLKEKVPGGACHARKVRLRRSRHLEKRKQGDVRYASAGEQKKKGGGRKGTRVRLPKGKAGLKVNKTARKKR